MMFRAIAVSLILLLGACGGSSSPEGSGSANSVGAGNGATADGQGDGGGDSQSDGQTGGGMGGGSGDGSGSGDGGTGAAVPARSMNVDIPSNAMNSISGDAITMVRATVYIPAHNEGETYPLLINSHGWGGNRVSQADVDSSEPRAADSGDNYFDLVDRRVEEMWNAGYAVISYDERGFGRGDDGDDGTPDGAHGMSPDFEIKDASAVIDWALANLDLTLEAAGDPVMGSFGGSYGGAFQLMLAAVDTRIDAIVPSATWFDFEESILPNGVVKKAYGHGLCIFAVVDMAELAAETQEACNEGSTKLNTRETEDASLVAQNVFRNNSLAAIAREPGFSMPPVDALLLQGNRDTLFNLGQSVRSYEFLAAAGGDVRMITHEDGHSLTIIRNGPGSQGEQGDAFCGPIDAVTSIRGWFDEKLLGAAATTLPRICWSLDDFTGVHLTEIPRGSENFRVSLPTGTEAMGSTHHNDTSDAGEAVFVPLDAAISADGLVLAGVPVARLTITAGATNVDPTPIAATSDNDAAAFLGIGLRRDGITRLVDQQLTPLTANDERTGSTPVAVELVGVGEKLKVGDQVGLLIFARHDQYENHIATGPETGTNWRTNHVVVSGQVDLPIFSSAVTEREQPANAASLCVSSDCGSKSAIGPVFDAENMLFSSDGRYFVSGGEQVFELTSDDAGGFNFTGLSASSCNFTGLAIVGSTLYANCFSGTLWAGDLATSPLVLSQIYSYDNAANPNGLEAGPDGELFTANGPTAATGRRLIKLTPNAENPLQIDNQEDWFTGTFSPNGMARLGDDIYFTETDMTSNARVVRLPIEADGSAGTPVTVLQLPGQVFDDLSVVERGSADSQLLITSFFSGTVILADLSGNVVSQFQPGSFSSPTQAMVGRPPLFDNTVLLVTEKGTIGDNTQGNGNVLSRVDPLP